MQFHYKLYSLTRPSVFCDSKVDRPDTRKTDRDVLEMAEKIGKRALETTGFY